MTGFEFATATRILFGAGTFAQVAPQAGALGDLALVVTGQDPQRSERILRALAEAGLKYVHFAVGHEPTLSLVTEGVELARRKRCNVIVSIGGGSAIDTGKAIAALLSNPGEPTDYLEVVGRGKALANPPIPFIAAPTTAGTGSEVTRNAVIGVADQSVKVSLRSPLMLPRLAIVDPELTYGLPPAVTAATGLDALTQVIEPYVSVRANPLIDALCRSAIQQAPRALMQVYRLEDPEARAAMSFVSLCGGLALANAGLGAVHGFAGPLGGMFPAPHGAVCGCLLPHVTAANIAALRARDPESRALSRYGEVAQWLTGDPGALPEDGVTWLMGALRDLAIPGLARYGITEADIPLIVEKSARASSMKGNPVSLSGNEMSAILLAALRNSALPV